MAIQVDINSYISVADADAYFADRLFSSVWTTANADDKPKALIQATKAIEELSFNGYRYLETQVLSFPRYELFIDGIEQDPSIVPNRVKEAVCEYAIAMLSEDYTAPNDLDQFESVSLGSISIDVNNSKKTKSLPPKVASLLSSFMTSGISLARG